jgi:LytR cell envelope-related transcriptional attenuator
MQSVTSGDIEFQTVPYVGDSKDKAGRYILKLEDIDTLHAFFEKLSADPKKAAAPTTAAPPSVAPADVSVEVLNGSGTSGLAAKAGEGLTANGFTVTSTGNADSHSYTKTEIRFAAGDDALAATLASQVPGATTKESQDATKGTVQLVLGSDFTTIGQAVTPTKAAPVTEGKDPRTAADTSCIN